AVDTGARAQLVEVGPPSSLADPVENIGCPVLAAHEDGSFAAAWTLGGDGGTRLLVRGGDDSGVLADLHGAYPVTSAIDSSQLVATDNGFSLVWRARQGATYPHW